MKGRSGSVVISSASKTGGFALAAVLLCASACKDEVRFGPPNGLRAEEGGDVLLCMPAEATGTPCPDWASQIFTPLFDAGKPYGCANANCHGLTEGGGLFMPPNDAIGSYNELADYTNGGIPYISNDPNNAYILCNLTTEADLLIGNQPMPVVGGVITSFVTPEDYLLIANWVQCGMPQTGMGAVASTGVGGAGGMVGMGAGGI
jgi:hypothetical protein